MRKLKLAGILSLALCAGALAQTPAPDPRAIVQKSLESFNRGLDLRRNYTYQKRETERQLDNDGHIKSTEVRTYEVIVVDDQPRMRLIARNDQPLSPAEQQKEDERLRKAQEKDQKVRDNPQKREEEERKFARLIMDTYNFALVGEDAIDGEPVWIIQGEPNRAYKPQSMEGRLLKCLHGKLWISKRDYQWARVDAEMLDDFSVGWFLAKLHKGARIFLDQTRINDEIWLPRRESFNLSLRVGFKTQNVQEETAYSGYKKFRAEANVRDVREAPSETAPKP